MVHTTDPQPEAPAAGGAAPAPLPEDPIVAEVRAIREAQFEAAGYNLEEYVRRMREVQARSGHPVVSLPPRPARESAA